MAAMGLISLQYQNTDRSEPFCCCQRSRKANIQGTSSIPQHSSAPNYGGSAPLRNHCTCGESDSYKIEWQWDRSLLNSEVQLDGTNVLFHPVYSQGTAIVRGDKPLLPGMHYYWEIKIISPLCGTEVMIGIGTENVDLTSYLYRFASVLGINDQSWGYSYRGLIQHNGHLKYYGKKYTEGCIVGIYVDMHRGTIEFFLNRRSQGRAFRNIPIGPDSNNIYPMACSTLAKTSMRLINSCSFKESLQFNCMKVIAKSKQMVDELEKMPGLRHLLDDLWFLRTHRLPNRETNANEPPLEDEAIICGIKTRKTRYGSEGSNDSSSDFDGIYGDNMFKVKRSKQSEHPTSDEEAMLEMNGFFCDH